MAKFDPTKIYQETAEREMLEALESDNPFKRLKPVEGNLGKNLADLVTFRLRSDELQEIENAAAREGMNLSEFLRRAALTRARESEGLPLLTPSLANTLDQLTRQYQELRRKPRASGTTAKARAASG